MARQGSAEGDGAGDYDHATTKPVEESSGGKHSTDDRGDTGKDEDEK